MGKSYARLMFTPLVKSQQLLHGSRGLYERLEERATAEDRLSPMEQEFITTRDSFYMASTTETGWPYLQHRGGKPGFVHILDEQTIAFADLRGNRQYISLANLLHDDRVSLFFMDYPHRARLKLLGHATIHENPEDKALLKQLRMPGEKIPVERAIVIRVVGLDWNCSQNITPRYTEEDILGLLDPLRRRIEELQKEAQSLREKLQIQQNGEGED